MTEPDGAARLRERVWHGYRYATMAHVEVGGSITKCGCEGCAALDAYAVAEKATMPCYTAWAHPEAVNWGTCLDNSYAPCPSCTIRKSANEAEQALRALGDA